MKYFKMSAVLIFSLLFFIMFFILIVDLSKNYNVVAEVNDYELKEKELQESLDELYRDTVITSKVNDILIREEIKSVKYKNLDKEEFNKAKKYYSLINNLEIQGNDINKKLRDEIEFLYYTLLLIKKHTITDEELNTFWNEKKNDSVYTEYQVKVYTDEDHNKLKQIENDLAIGTTLKDIENKYKIKFKNETVTENNTIFLDLSQLNTSEYLHIMNYTNDINIENEDESENHESHESHENHEERLEEGIPAILILEKINGLSKTLKNDKDEISDYYITKNIYKEKIELINYLKSKHKVKLRKK